MHTYSEEQLTRYFKFLGRPPGPPEQHDPLSAITLLQVHHMARVPFESLTLHYSAHRVLSLDPEDLFQKIVVNGRGGYCMEVNTFFGTVLRSLGLTVVSIGARGNSDRGYKGWNHMANIVTIDDKKYLVDVGFGSHGPPYPVLLEYGHEFMGIAPARGKLEYKSLDTHTDPDQRVWVFSSKENESEPWKERYAFVTIEFFPADFEVMNLTTMTARQSYFVQTVMCMRTILDSERVRPEGLLILHRDYVKKRVGDKSDILETLRTEEQRVKALETYFGIVLGLDEQRAIRGLASELGRQVLADV
ncbi:hypothetical protein B0T19DRAFT_112395 [Cercophora scortea]|uniref:Arylamine N-acetyltransferase n=1 Tax=Cercophora scortea TaxID=314031 RepID=A0AAE0IX20_9PEZI|nr:hypothetical protein B0T19DRAFT_112395 [Cercophora scortea]